jgi:hypothetical protein
MNTYVHTDIYIGGPPLTMTMPGYNTLMKWAKVIKKAQVILEVAPSSWTMSAETLLMGSGILGRRKFSMSWVLGRQFVGRSGK